MADVIPSSGGVASNSDKTASTTATQTSSFPTNYNDYRVEFNRAIARKLKHRTFTIEIEQLASIIGIQLPSLSNVSFPRWSPSQNHTQDLTSLLQFLNRGASVLGYSNVEFIDVGTRTFESHPVHSRDKPDIVALRNAEGQLNWANVAISGKLKVNQGPAAERQIYRYLCKMVQAQPGLDLAMSFMVCGGTNFHLYFVNPSAVFKLGPVDMTTNDIQTTFQCLAIICSFIKNYPSFSLIARIKSSPDRYSLCQLEPIFSKDSMIGSRTFVFSAVESTKRVICKSVWLPDYLVNNEFNVIKKLNQNGLKWGVPNILFSGVLDQDQDSPMSVTWVDSEHQHLVRYRQISLFQEDMYRCQPPHLIQDHQWPSILAGLADVTRTVFLAWKMAWIYHQDISVNNIVFPAQPNPTLLHQYHSQISQCNIADIPQREPLGILIDWENSRQHHLRPDDPLAGRDRLDGIHGTLPFMSENQTLHILAKEHSKVKIPCHLPLDDLESLFWLTIWIVAGGPQCSDILSGWKQVESARFLYPYDISIWQIFLSDLQLPESKKLADCLQDLLNKLRQVTFDCWSSFGTSSELKGQNPEQQPELFHQSTKEWAQLFQSAVSAYDQAFVTLYESFDVGS